MKIALSSISYWLFSLPEQLGLSSQQYELALWCAIFLLLLGLLVLRVARRKQASIENISPREEGSEKDSQLESSVPVAPALLQTPRFEEAKVDSVLAELPDLSAVPSATAVRVEAGLNKTRTSFFSKLRGIFSAPREREKIFRDLEELFITSDLGVKTTNKLLETLRKTSGTELSEEFLRATAESVIEGILSSDTPAEIAPTFPDGKLKVILVVGVNGVGKTTTIAKLSSRFKSSGAKILLGACDTFRAAAADQLQVWAERIGVDIETGANEEKPSTVAYRAVHRALDQKHSTLIIDTAGRLHTRGNLMNELAAVARLISREYPGAPHETILVVDATTGQNALQQAIEFNKVTPLTGVVVTKLDGTPKGGITVAIKDEVGVPIRYIGLGEGQNDLQPFNSKEFTAALLMPSDPSSTVVTSTKIQRRRRVSGEA